MQFKAQTRRLETAKKASSFQIGERWEHARKLACIPANLAGEAMGVASPRITEIEHGIRLPTMALVTNAALLYGCSADYLAGISSCPFPSIDVRVRTAVRERIDAELERVVEDVLDACETTTATLRTLVALTASLSRSAERIKARLIEWREACPDFDEEIPASRVFFEIHALLTEVR